jgi:cytochrome c oxidase assembly protein subunit 15
MNLQVFLEWFHRLDAFLVGLALLVLCGFSLLRRRQLPRWLPWLSGAALVLVGVQGLLGALTVTQLLRFDVVTAHLATALVLVALASGLHQGLLAPVLPFSEPLPAWRRRGWAVASAIAGVAVFAQAVSGALMATQWASGRCLAAAEACDWLGLHRSLATPVAAAVVVVSAALCVAPGDPRRHWPFALAAAVLVAVQIGLGIATLRLALTAPLVTVGHQITAALLLALLSALTVRCWRVSPAVAISASAPLNRSPLETCHG